jgi:hypothetical protein
MGYGKVVLQSSGREYHDDSEKLEPSVTASAVEQMGWRGCSSMMLLCQQTSSIHRLQKILTTASIQVPHEMPAGHARSSLETMHSQNHGEREGQGPSHHAISASGTHFGKHPGSPASQRTAVTRAEDKSDNPHRLDGEKGVIGGSENLPTNTRDPTGDDQGVGGRNASAVLPNMKEESLSDSGSLEDAPNVEKSQREQSNDGARADDMPPSTSSEILEDKEADPDMPLF